MHIKDLTFETTKIFYEIEWNEISFCKNLDSFIALGAGRLPQCSLAQTLNSSSVS